MTELFRIVGDVGSAVFPVWIARHTQRLGLRSTVLSHAPDRLELILSGPADLLDAMALGCSLGPQEVWVETILRDPQSDGRPDFPLGNA
jgi:hypothetical protein